MSQRDRLAELQSDSNNYFDNSFELQQLQTNLNHSTSNSTLNIQHQSLPNHQSFFQTAESIRRNIEIVKTNTKNLDSLNRKALSEVNL